MTFVFTGIVQHVGRVVDVISAAGGSRLRIEVGPLREALSCGASLAVDGACLTVAEISGARAESDAVPETLSRTTLGDLRPGSRVNLEAALPSGAPLDGHIVQGHVDGVARVARIERGGGGRLLHLAAGTELTDQMVVKGSVALAGVSLTLVDVVKGSFSVALVPTTIQRTTLGSVRISDRLNVELDIIGKYVRRHLGALAGGSVTVEKLRQAGFA